MGNIKNPQNIIIHDFHYVDGEKRDVSLNTNGTTPSNLREHLYMKVHEAGVNPKKLTELRKTTKIGKVWFNKDKWGEYYIKKIDIDKDILDEF